MHFSWDFNTATLVLIVVQIVAFVVFIVRTHSVAQSASEMADKAHKRADDAHIAISAYHATLMLFKEHVASEYVDKSSLRDMEGRLVDAINRLGDRLDRMYKVER